MSVNPQDYDREERKSSTWWSSRHDRSLESMNVQRQIRRLTLIDLMILLVMAGIIIPFALHKDTAYEIGAYRIRIKEEVRGDGLLVTLTMDLPSRADPGGASYAGWIIYDENGFQVHQDRDLPPPPGGTREFIFLPMLKTAFQYRIFIGEETLILPPVK
jgi:hypothetical protein